MLQQQATLPNAWWCYALLLCGLIRWLAHDALGRLRPVTDIALGLAAGFLWAGLVAQVRLADRLLPEWEGVDIEVQGVVAELPQFDERGARFRFDVERVITPLAGVPSKIQLSYISVPDLVVPSFHAGERWHLSVRLKRPHSTQNPHLFDREYWQLEQGVRASGYVRAKGTVTRLDALVERPGYLVERLREVIRDRILQATSPGPATGVLIALAVGDQAAIPRDQWQLFTRTGVNHLMSISGLHITMLSGLAALIAGWGWRRSARLVQWLPARRAALMAGVCVAWSYAAMAGFGLPAQRTVLMLSTVAIALSFARAWPAVWMLALVLFIVTVFDPFAVMTAGFWLSFGAVALLLYIGNGRIGRSFLVVEWARAQWAMSLGLIPLLVILFQQVSVVSPVANAVAVPLVSFIVVPVTLVGAVLPGDWVLVLAERIMSWCVLALQFVDGLPIAVWQQAMPPLWILMIASLGIVWILAPRGFPAKWMGYTALLPLFVYSSTVPASGEFWMDVLDVGQGLSVLIRTQSHAALFDAGPRYGDDSDAGDRIVTPYLRAAGVRRLDGLIISHDDSDHSGGALSVIKNVPVTWMVSSIAASDEIHGVASRSLRCFAGQRWEWDDVGFEMLHPSPASYDVAHLKDNDRSCVLRVTARAGSALIPGDIEAKSEIALSRDNPHLLRADVLLAPHHGSGTSSTEQFLRDVAPKQVVFTNGYRNSYGHPKQEVVERYERLHVRSYRSDHDGALRYRFAAQGIDARAWRVEHRRYWYE